MVHHKYCTSIEFSPCEISICISLPKMNEPDGKTRIVESCSDYVRFIFLSIMFSETEVIAEAFLKINQGFTIMLPSDH